MKAVPRIALLSDYREEKWPSMDLTSDMLFRFLREGHAESLEVEQIRPEWKRPASAVLPGPVEVLHNVDRLYNRFVAYPSWARRNSGGFDVFHIADHSYSQLALELPAARTIITCHDLDTFRCLLEPAAEPRPRWFQWMAARTLRGLRRAAHVVCVSEATRAALLRLNWFREEQLSVIYSGVQPELSPHPEAAEDEMVKRLCGGRPYLLHVGSCIERKRIDVLLRVFAGVAAARPLEKELVLLKVGGTFTEVQKSLAQELGIWDRIVHVASAGVRQLAACYRNSQALLQTSDAEGFGLPVIEALLCRCPVFASDLPVLREAGGVAGHYCAVANVESWIPEVVAMLRERVSEPAVFSKKLLDGEIHAARFTWQENARATSWLYGKVVNAE